MLHGHKSRTPSCRKIYKNKKNCQNVSERGCSGILQKLRCHSWKTPMAVYTTTIRFPVTLLTHAVLRVNTQWRGGDAF